MGSYSFVSFNASTKERLMKLFLFFVVVIISCSSASTDTVLFGLNCVIHSSAGSYCVVENPKNTSEIWTVFNGEIRRFDNFLGPYPVKKTIIDNWTCQIDNFNCLWIGGKGCIARFNIKDSTYVVYDTTKAKSLALYTRDIEYDAANNRIVLINDAGACFINLTSKGDIASWQDFPEVGKKRSIGLQKIFCQGKEVFVVTGFVYHYDGTTWKTYDTSCWHSALAVGSAMDPQGNLHVGGGMTIVKRDRLTGEWSHLGITGHKSSPCMMEIDKRGICLFEGYGYYCKFDLNDPDLKVENFVRLDMKWDALDPTEDLCHIQLTSAGNFMILGDGGWVVMKDENAVRPFTTVFHSAEKTTFVGFVDPLGRLKFEIISAGNYFAIYRTGNGKQIVKKSCLLTNYKNK
jgi:hypothetical protein